MSNFIKFLELYKTNLRINRISNPHLYYWDIEQCDLVAEKAVIAMSKRLALIDSITIRTTCKELDILFNDKAIADYLNAKE